MRKSEIARDSFLGACFGAFAADAFGYPFENQAFGDRFAACGIVDGMRGSSWSPAGTYSDDTQMQFAVLATLARVGCIDQEELVRQIVAVVEPERGYGDRMLYEYVGPVRRGADWRSLGRDSYGNGGAMRVAPVGCMFFGDVHRLIDEAKKSCEVTHTHPLAVDGAVVQALAVGLAMEARTKVEAISPKRFIDNLLGLLPTIGAEFASRMKPILELDLKAPPPEFCRLISETWRTDLKADESVPPAIACFLSSQSYQETVIKAMNASWDSDTVAAMAGALAGAYWGLGSVPASWIAVLENTRQEKSMIESHVAACLEHMRAQGLLP